MTKNTQTTRKRLISGFLAGLAAAAMGVGLAGAQQNAQDQAAQGQQPQIQALESVAAIVNDTPISTFDLRQRIQLIALTSGGSIPEDAMAQIQSRALQDLIEEQLKLAEAQSVDFDVPPEEVEEQLAQIAANSNSTVQQLEQELAAAGISLDTLRRQIRTRLVWEQLVAGRYSSRIYVTDDEIDAVMERLRSESRDEQYLVSEICLPVREDMSMTQIEQAGMQIIGQMQQGVPFNALARQFSVCSSAANGGDLGWMLAGELDPTLGNVIRQLETGSVSRPIPYEGTMRILAVREKREAATQGVRSYEMGYASVPDSYSEEEAREIFARMPESNICNSDQLSVDLGADTEWHLLPMLPVTQFEAAFRPEIETLDRGDISTPIRADGSWHGMLLCAKDEGLGLPSREQIEDRLYAEQLDLISRRYLRDVERDSSVQILLGANQNG